MSNKPSLKYLREICLNNETIVQKLLDNMKMEIIKLLSEYEKANDLMSRKSIVHKSVTLFSMIGMKESANKAKMYEVNLQKNLEIGKREFEEDLQIAINFLR